MIDPSFAQHPQSVGRKAALRDRSGHQMLGRSSGEWAFMEELLQCCSPWKELRCWATMSGHQGSSVQERQHKTYALYGEEWQGKARNHWQKLDPSLVEDQSLPVFLLNCLKKVICCDCEPIVNETKSQDKSPYDHSVIRIFKSSLMNLKCESLLCQTIKQSILLLNCIL